MGTPIARIGDAFVGICICHPTPIGMTGIIVTGASISTCESSPITRIGDIGIGVCGHITMIVTGAEKCVVEGSPPARIGDAVAGCINGLIVTGAEKSFIE